MVSALLRSGFTFRQHSTYFSVEVRNGILRCSPEGSIRQIRSTLRSICSSEGVVTLVFSI